MQLNIRRWYTQIDEINEVMGQSDELGPLRKVAVCAIMENPYAGEYVKDLSELVAASEPMADELCRRARAALGTPVQSYGKGGLVGTAGEQEQVNALLTTVFGNAMRHHADGGFAWVPSFTKRAERGEPIDIPLAHKDALYVRSHYDGLTVKLADSPGPDEFVAIAVYANRGRINARIGGVPADRITGQDGLR
ncbi:amino acid synthesis family protein [Streptomyces sp. NPDC004838]